MSVPHLSTGLASLDDVLAPGQPLSSALLIVTPDEHSAWGKLMHRYWLSQGLLTGQGVVVVAGEGEGEELVEGAMWEATKPGANANVAHTTKADESASDGEGLEEEQDDPSKKKIAWRYGGMGKFKTTVDSHSGSGELDSLLTQTLTGFGLTWTVFAISQLVQLHALSHPPHPKVNPRIPQGIRSARLHCRPPIQERKGKAARPTDRARQSPHRDQADHRARRLPVRT